MEKLVEVESLIKDFGNVRAVNGISLELHEGEILGLLGPNGAGKTTTLQMLLDLTAPTSGSIKIFGKGFKSSRSEILGKVNFSSSYISLPFSLTVRENLNVFAMLYSVKDKRTKIDELMGLFEIADLANVPTRRLSSGQITRVCLAKALLNSPRVLFLDEPTASLDPDIADKTRQLLLEICKKEGLSIIYTSHNMKEVEEMCDRIIFMNRGTIVAAGRPEEIMKDFKEENLDEVFMKIAREGGGNIGTGAN